MGDSDNERKVSIRSLVIGVLLVTAGFLAGYLARGETVVQTSSPSSHTQYRWNSNIRPASVDTVEALLSSHCRNEALNEISVSCEALAWRRVARNVTNDGSPSIAQSTFVACRDRSVNEVSVSCEHVRLALGINATADAAHPCTPAGSVGGATTSDPSSAAVDCTGFQLPRFASWLTLPTYEAQHPCVLRPASRHVPNINDTFFLVLTGAVTQNQRIPQLLRSWVNLVPHKWIVSDAADEGMGIRTWPELAAGRDHLSAGNRQLVAMKHVVDDPDLGNKQWYFFADDDTFVNLFQLKSVLARYNPEIPVMFGWVWDRADWSYLSGGAGMLLSGEAFRRVARAFRDGACAFDNLAVDTSVGRCAAGLDVHIVSHGMFQIDPSSLCADPGSCHFPFAEGQITWHHIPPHHIEYMGVSAYNANKAVQLM